MTATISEGEKEGAKLAPFRLSEVTEMVTQLSRVMIREIDCLKEMKVKELESLQVEKIKLGAAIEMYRYEIARNPWIMDTFSENEKNDFRKISRIFGEVSEENERRLMVAKEVNEVVMHAIRDAVRDSMNNGLYDGSGDAASGNETVSFALNQTV